MSRPASASGPASQHSSAEMSSVVSQPNINPARAAFINNTDRANNSSHDRTEHRVGEHMQHKLESQPETTPTGPKAVRTTGSRDLFESAAGRNASQDQNRGRLNRDGTHQHSASGESSYGRLNGGPDLSHTPHAPDGPPSGRFARHNGADAANVPARMNERYQDSSARPADSPTNRRSQRGRDGDSLRSGPPNRPDPRPSTPATNMIAPTDNGPAVHPSRLANLEVDTIAARADVRGASSLPTAPSGPRSLNRPPPGTPTGPSPTSNAPSGPGLTNDRQRRGDWARGNGPQVGLTTSPTSSQGIQFRGAARQSSGQTVNIGGNSATADQPRALASSMEAPSRPDAVPFAGERMDRGRAEMIQRTSATDTSFGNRGAEAGRKDQERPNRAPSRERQFMNGGARQAEQYAGGSHDGRGSAGPPRRPAAPSAPGSFVDSATSYDWNPRDAGRGGGPLRRQDHGGAGRGVTAHGSAAEIDGRKRRFEDGGPSPFDGTKRRRSNR